MRTSKAAVLRTLPLVHLVARSGNAKTGDIPVTYRPMTTCPTDCPFLPTGDIGGCYGTGRIFGIASKYATPVIPYDDLSAKLGKASRSARFLRDRVVGDVLDADGNVDMAYILAMAALGADHGLTVFGYSHAWRRFTPAEVAETAASGYVLNASCETREDVQAAIDLGMPAVIASDNVADGETFVTPDGKTRRIVTCPAQTREGVSCASCGLCAKGDRAAVVRFQIHGTARNRAGRAVASRENGKGE